MVGTPLGLALADAVAVAVTVTVGAAVGLPLEQPAIGATPTVATPIRTLDEHEPLATSQQADRSRPGSAEPVNHLGRDRQQSPCLGHTAQAGGDSHDTTVLIGGNAVASASDRLNHRDACALTRPARRTTMRCMLSGEAGNLVAQMRRGVLPYCVLAMLRKKEQYGFELVHALGGVDGMVTGEGTIYPLLARLRRQGLVETSWQESSAGPPRKYYRLADAGQAALAEFSESWQRLRDSVDDLLASSGQEPF